MDCLKFAAEFLFCNVSDLPIHECTLVFNVCLSRLLYYATMLSVYFILL